MCSTVYPVSFPLQYNTLFWLTLRGPPLVFPQTECPTLVTVAPAAASVSVAVCSPVYSVSFPLQYNTLFWLILRGPPLVFPQDACPTLVTVAPAANAAASESQVVCKFVSLGPCSRSSVFFSWFFL